MTVLRDPVQRVWSRYWYDKGGSISEEKWLDGNKCGGGGRGVGNRCLSNYYVRTFRGHSSADTFGPGYSNGVPEGDLAKARDVLAACLDDADQLLALTQEQLSGWARSFALHLR